MQIFFLNSKLWEQGIPGRSADYDKNITTSQIYKIISQKGVRKWDADLSTVEMKDVCNSKAKSNCT